jgi:hypothetical protein
VKYELNVQVYLRPYQDGSGAMYAGGQIELRETQIVQLNTLSDAAGVLVKLHEFFEELKRRKA